MSLPFVSTRQDIDANLRNFSAAASAPMGDARRVMHDRLVRRGGCFVVYRRGSEVAFAPSRFVGYRNNDVLKHLDRLDETHGTKTNRRLDSLLREPLAESKAIEQLFKLYCVRRNIILPSTGPGGSARKFWVSMLPDNVRVTIEEAYLDQDPNLNATERKALRAARVGQGKFKADLLRFWKCCCLTGVTVGEVLRASHMKPWKSSDNTERLDVYNGLLLTPNADALFDAGLITFTDEGEMKVSSRVTSKEIEALLGKGLHRVALTAKHLPYLQYHRQIVFEA